MPNPRYVTLTEAQDLIQALPGSATKSDMLIHLDSFAEFVEDVAGDVKAHLILEDGHWFDIKGKVTADDIYTSHSAKPRGVLQPNLSAEELVDEVKEKDRLDLTKAMQYLMNNNFVFRK